MKLFKLDEEFTGSSLNIQGYDIIEIWRFKAKSEKFRAKSEVEFNPDVLTECIRNKGMIYGYVQKGVLKTLYIVRRNNNVFSCDECFYSKEICDEELIMKMDRQVAFLIAQHASAVKNGSAVFKGEVLPDLKSKSMGFNWSMGIVFAMLYSVVFVNAFHKEYGIVIGIMLGISMGFCFAKHTYHFESRDKASVSVEDVKINT